MTRHGLQTAALAEQVLAGQWQVELVRCAGVAEFRAAGERLRAAGEAGEAVHVDVTDALFGDTPGEAVVVLRGVVPDSATLALHDVPQPAEGAARYAARAAAYAELAGAFTGVVVASEHEAGFLRAACAEAGAEPAPISVVPLPVPDQRDRAGEGARAGDGGAPGGAGLSGAESGGAQAPGQVEGLERDVVVLGYLYPGKGHAEAVSALAAVRRQAAARGADLGGLPNRVTALGPVAAGHQDLVAELEQAAAAEGLQFRVTGFVPDAQLPAALDAAAVPFAAHRNVSASGSLATWMGHGRRCIVPAGAYVEEMEALRPGTLHVARAAATGRDSGADAGTVAQDAEATVGGAADDGAVLEALTRALAAAVADPSLTRLAPSVSLAPTPEDTVRALADVWGRALGASRTRPTTVEGGGQDD